MILDTAADKPAVVRAIPRGNGAPEDWHAEHPEGQLAVDVLETAEEVIVISTMAGADTSDIQVYIHNDLLTLRGKRLRPVKESEAKNTFHEECFWGNFSRSIVLPVEVKADLAKAEYKNGVLVVRVPKQRTEAKIQVTIIEE